MRNVNQLGSIVTTLKTSFLIEQIRQWALSSRIFLSRLDEQKERECQLQFVEKQIKCQLDFEKKFKPIFTQNSLLQFVCLNYKFRLSKNLLEKIDIINFDVFRIIAALTVYQRHCVKELNFCLDLINSNESDLLKFTFSVPNNSIVIGAQQAEFILLVEDLYQIRIEDEMLSSVSNLEDFSRIVVSQYFDSVFLTKGLLCS